MAAIPYYYFGDTKYLLWIAPGLLAIGIAVVWANRIEPYSLCCRVEGFDSIRQNFERIAEEESLPRPTIANPDLGVMSWHKQFNIVDLGRLGTPIMAKFDSDIIMADYFFDFMAPDMIESHSAWSCKYGESIFTGLQV